MKLSVPSASCLSPVRYYRRERGENAKELFLSAFSASSVVKQFGILTRRARRAAKKRKDRNGLKLSVLGDLGVQVRFGMSAPGAFGSSFFACAVAQLAAECEFYPSESQVERVTPCAFAAHC